LIGCAIESQDSYHDQETCLQDDFINQLRRRYHHC